MSAPRTAPTQARRAGHPAGARAAKRESLSVVRPDQRARSVGLMGSLFALFVFATLFALAALHAVLVQTQSRIDEINRENSLLREELDERIAQEARLDSPEGLHEAAISAGLVEATEVVGLVPVADGTLGPPVSTDPFRSGAAG